MKTAIRTCFCQHAFQDRKYGHMKRVMNARPNKGGKDAKTIYRCTVCGKEDTK